MRWQQLGMVAAAVACMAAPSMAQLSTLGNAGFESPITYDVAPAVGNWVAFFGGAPTLAAAVDSSQFFTGAQSLRIAITNGGGASFCGVQQPVTGVQAGLNYTLRFRAKKGFSVTNPVEFRVEWKNIADGFLPDPNGQFSNNQSIATQLTTDWQQFTWTGAAPTETARANVVFAVQTFGFTDPLNPGFNTEVFIDDVEFVLASTQPTTGKCCDSSGGCTITTQALCNAVFTANGVCTPNTCPGAVGACCSSTGGCAFVAPGICSSLNGTFQGPGVSCGPNPCTASQPSGGACCNGATCATVTSAAACTGFYLGNGSSCSPAARGPVNVCCLADFDNSGARSIDDIFIFLNAWFAGCP